MRTVLALLLTVQAASCGETATTTSAPAAETDKALKLYARGDYAAVVRMLQGPCRRGQGRIQDRLLLARAQLHLHREAEALAILESVLESDAENPEANALMGRILHRRDKHAEAIAYLRRAYRLRRDPATAAMLGRSHYALGNVAKAKTYLEKALEKDIRDPDNSFLLGLIHLRHGQGALAERYLLLARDAGMTGPELHRLLGRAYLLQHKELGPVLLRSGPAGAAPGDIIDGQVVLGPVAGVEGRYKVCTRYSALYEALQLLKIRPGDPDGLYMAAAGWFAAGQYALADAQLSALTRRRGPSPRLLELQARVCIARRDFPALQKCLRTALARRLFSPQRAARFYYQAAVALRAEGDRRQALELLQQADHLHPTSEPVLRALAGLALSSGRAKLACRCYRRLIELFPDAEDLDELRNRLKVLEGKETSRAGPASGGNRGLEPAIGARPSGPSPNPAVPAEVAAVQHGRGLQAGPGAALRTRQTRTTAPPVARKEVCTWRRA